MNRYTCNLNRVEFAVTYACTGKCRHCSEGGHSGSGQHVDPEMAAKVVLEAAACRKIESVMTFGGEPLLYPETVYAVHAAAKKMDIPKRQLITNGFFSRNIDRIAAVSEALAESGVNDILLSADAFHQETIPLEPVRQFALYVRRLHVAVRVHPAWLVSSEHDNLYNNRTRAILRQLEQDGIPASEGNIIFPSGNALRYFSEYFEPGTQPGNPYEQNPEDIRAVCVEPNGDVLSGNVYETGIEEILEAYAPRKA